jgi:hypothetical protein
LTIWFDVGAHIAIAVALRRNEGRNDPENRDPAVIASAAIAVRIEMA